MKYMFLHGVGNPDFQQYADVAPLVMSKDDTNDWEDTFREQLRWYISEHDMGGGNCGFRMGAVWEEDQGSYTYLGRFSYNGRYWPKNDDPHFKMPITEMSSMRRFLRWYLCADPEARKKYEFEDYKQRMEEAYEAFLKENCV